MQLTNCDSCPINYNKAKQTTPLTREVDYVFVVDHNRDGEASQMLLSILETLHVTSYVILNATLCPSAPSHKLDDEALMCCNRQLHFNIDKCGPKRIIALGDLACRALQLNSKQNIWQKYKNSIDAIVVSHPYSIIAHPNGYFNYFRAIMKAAYGQPNVVPIEEFTLISDPLKAIEALKPLTKMSFDIETANGLDPRNNFILTTGIYSDQLEKPIVLTAAVFLSPSFLDFLEEHNKTCPYIGSNIVNFDSVVLLNCYDCKLDNLIDTIHLDYCYNECETGKQGIVKRGLKTLANLLCDAPPYADELDPYMHDLLSAPPDLLNKYTARDGFYSWHVYKALSDPMDEREKELCSTILSPYSIMLRDMSIRGTLVDVPAIIEFGKELDEQIYVATAEFPCNPRSPTQMAVLFYDELKFRKVNKRSTDAGTLAMLEELYPKELIFVKLSKLRNLEKLRNTYVTGLLRAVDENNYLHTTFLMEGTNTGRISSREPNLQNIPTRTELGKRIKACFITPDNYKGFFNIDYSSLEVRVLAIYSNDKLLVEMINNGKDIHRYAASIWFEKSEAEITSEERQWLKSAVFGVAYGLTDEHAGYQLGITRGEGRRLVQAIKRDIFPGLGSFIEEQQRKAIDNKFIDYFDSPRRRHFHLITSLNLKDVLKHAVNSPIQGRGSDFNLEAAYKVRHLDGIRLVVHDSICGYYNSLDELNEIKEAMENKNYQVPLEVEVSIGTNWADCKPITL